MSLRYSSCRSLSVAEHPLEQHVREPDHGVERRAQLVRHAGQELGLVPARHLELARLALELAEQPRVVDRHRGLARERLEQVDGRRRRRRRAPSGARPARRGSRRSRSSGTASIERQPAVPQRVEVRVAAPRAQVGDLARLRRSSRRGRRTSRPGGCASARSAVDEIRARCRGTRAGGTAPSPRRTRRSSRPRCPRARPRGVTIVARTSSTSRLELTAWPISPSACSSSTERASSLLALLRARNRCDVLDRDRALRRKVVEHARSCGSSNGSTSAALQHDHARRRARRRASGRPASSVCRRARRPGATRTRGSRSDVADPHDAALQPDAADHRAGRRSGTGAGE